MKKQIISIICFAALTTFAGCFGDEPLFTNLAENRLKVVLKGSFESNSPRPWWDGAAADGIMVAEKISDDSITACRSDLTTSDGPPTALFLDIAEMRLDGDRFSNYRQTKVFGLDDSSAVFNGQGYELRNDDVTPEYTYYNLEIFLRKLLFDQARVYRSDGNGAWSYIQKFQSIFKEEYIDAYDCNQLNLLTIWDMLRTDRSATNRVFPLRVPISGGLVFTNDRDQVLEVRIVVKNFIKKYEVLSLYGISDTLSFTYNSYLFYNFSDWLWDMQPGDSYMGGNMIAIARTYTPGKTVTISGSAGATNCYIVAIPASDVISSYEISGGTNPVRPSASFGSSSPDMNYYPFVPVKGNSDIESVLDTQVSTRMMYKMTNDFVANATGTAYASTWDAYNAQCSAYKIPPIVTWVGAGGTYKLENVPAGASYKLYRSALNGATPVAISELPADYDDATEKSVTVADSEAGTEITINF